MLRIGICDDEQEMRFNLRWKLERIFESRMIENDIFEFSSGDGLMYWYTKNAGVLDLIFLDIEMDGANGMETAEKLRASNANIQIVFVTGHPDYVFDGYKVSALGYLMKPPASDKLEDIIIRALTALHMNSEKVYICRNSEGLYRIPKSSILYFSSDKRLVTCVAETRKYSFYGKLDDVAGEIGEGFVRIHNRYIVNAMMVQHIEGNSVRINDEVLPISRGYQKTTMIALTHALL